MAITSESRITEGQIFRAWVPLAASWILMSLELPAVSAVLLRLSDPELHLAAFGSIAFPLAMIIEAPIINLLSASTTLCRDWHSYRRSWRFMMAFGAALTLLHALLTFSPLFDLVIVRTIGAPAATHRLVFWALVIMLPWTWTIGYRRFHQGLLIRFGSSRSVSAGTAVRMLTNAVVLTVGLLSKAIPGVILGALSVTSGVIAEALFIDWRCRKIKEGALRTAPPYEPALTNRGFLVFYLPLALTSVLYLIIQPMGSAALSRMPHSLESLATWPVITGLMFFFRSPAIAMTEVVVAHIEAKNGAQVLLQFALKVIVVLTILCGITALSPLGEIYCRSVAGLSPELAHYAASVLFLGIPVPALNAISSWHLGQLLHERRTRHFTEAVAVFLLVAGTILVVGVRYAVFSGLSVTLFAILCGFGAQSLWLSRSLRKLRAEKPRAK